MQELPRENAVPSSKPEDHPQVVHMTRNLSGIPEKRPPGLEAQARVSERSKEASMRLFTGFYFISLGFYQQHWLIVLCFFYFCFCFQQIKSLSEARKWLQNRMTSFFAPFEQCLPLPWPPIPAPQVSAIFPFPAFSREGAFRRPTTRVLFNLIISSKKKKKKEREKKMKNKSWERPDYVDMIWMHICVTTRRTSIREGPRSNKW